VPVRGIDLLEVHRRVKASDVLKTSFFVAIGDLEKHPLEKFFCIASVTVYSIEESGTADRVTGA
jgi:hypothetical protein